MAHDEPGTADPSALAGRRPDRYQFCVQGHLSARWDVLFDGMTVTAEDGGTTRIEGPIQDQAELHAVLRCIRDLGLELISVVRGPPA